MPEFYPTLFFGFQLENSEHVLHQMFVDNLGNTEWRPVPMISLDKIKRAECIADAVIEPENRDIE